MMQSIIYIGMDVHKSTISLCAFQPETGEILREVKCANDSKLVNQFVEKIDQQMEVNVSFIAGYEAGVLGYSLHNELQRMGIDCVIMAPTTMYHSVKNKAVKNDKMDARMIAQNLANGTYRKVHVPDKIDVETKEYIRMFKDFKKAQKVVKQQINALVLRQGFTYSGKSKWTQVHLKWLDELPMTDFLKETLDEYLVQYRDLVQKIDRFNEKLEALSHSDRYEEQVQKLRCFKGIETTSAMIIHVEISDFSRFPTAKAFMSYLGLTPGEHSSGDHTHPGSITKQGNSLVRTTIVECVHSLVRGRIGYKSRGVAARQTGQPAKIISYADKGTQRLQRRYYQLVSEGKPVNVAITAVARELAGYIWGMENDKLA